MKKILWFSVLLIAGLVASQFLGETGAYPIKLLTMFTLAFIMIHVGFEFDIDKSRPGRYAWDYVVAATAAAFPWLFCSLYFIFVMAPAELWGHPDLWKESLIEGRFASPTSAGVLFSMLAAAGLAASWVFKKARILAIFDDLDTILLMIPLTFLMVGYRWQLLIVIILMAVMLGLAWICLNRFRLPATWPFVMVYAGLITLFCEMTYQGSKMIDAGVPIHLEVLLPAFVLGCVIAVPKDPKRRPHEEDDEHHGNILSRRGEQRAALLVSACFMVFVGLSMPAIKAPRAKAARDVPAAATRQEPGPDNQPVEKASRLTYQGASAEALAEKNAFPGWGTIAVHVLAITVLSNLGKMFPVFCYRREVGFRERLAVALCMFPRGEVGAGVLVISLSYGLSGPAITVAALSLALNLLCTGLFIVVVKRLLVEPGV